jgi:hypothetical protein
MNLVSGDAVVVSKDSFAKLKIDDDKYVLAEANTRFTVNGNNNSKSSNYKLNLDYGAITTEIQKKLNKDSTYEVVTPNSTMSVRGTEFRIEVTKDKDGQIVTNIQVFEGTVAVVHDNYSGNEILVEKGKCAQVTGDDASTKLTYTDKAMTLNDISNLPQVTLKFLVNSINNGKDLCFSKDEICSLIDETETSFTSLNGAPIISNEVSGTLENQQSDYAQSGTVQPGAVQSGVSNETNAVSTNNPVTTDAAGNIETNAVITGCESTNEIPPKQETVKPQGQTTTAKNEHVVTQAPNETTKVPVTTKPAVVTTAKPSTTKIGFRITFITKDIGFGDTMYFDIKESSKTLSELLSENQYLTINVEGWYKDPGLTDLCSPNESISESITLYPKLK